MSHIFPFVCVCVGGGGGGGGLEVKGKPLFSMIIAIYRVREGDMGPLKCIGHNIKNIEHNQLLFSLLKDI